MSKNTTAIVQMTQVTVVIATAFGRTSWLVDRALHSVYAQEGVDRQAINVLIVDDNDDDDEMFKIEKRIQALRGRFGFNDSEFPTTVLRNECSKSMSGSGAWNTGITFAYRQRPFGFISILDDDDEYLNHHLADCIGAVDADTQAVLQPLIWQEKDGSRSVYPLRKTDFAPEVFFVGNPGVQGSNMFFRTALLIEVGGFDESLPNTTDRDLMIRILSHFSEKGERSYRVVKLIDRPGVIHHNHTEDKVNNRMELKFLGLRRFYEKHRTSFSQTDYQRSLERAKTLFKFTG